MQTLCASKLGDVKTLPLERNLLVRLHKIPSLSACRVRDGEQFGRLAHWALLIQRIGAPNIVLYSCAMRQWWVICAKASNTQKVNTRSALCWLRDGAGLGFATDDTRGVFRIDVFRSRWSTHDDVAWTERLAQLVASVSKVFPASTFDDH